MVGVEDEQGEQLAALWRSELSRGAVDTGLERAKYAKVQAANGLNPSRRGHSWALSLRRAAIMALSGR